MKRYVQEGRRLSIIRGAVTVVFPIFVFYNVNPAPKAQTASYWPSILAVFAILALGFAAFFTFRWLQALRRQTADLAQKAEMAQQAAFEAQQRLAAVFQVRHRFIDASEEQEVVEGVLEMAIKFTNASGASYVPLDERGQPLPAIQVGEGGPDVPGAWVEYLASPAVRDRCKVCEKHNHFSRTCPLLKGPFSEETGLYCLPLKRGEREFGVLNLYFPAHASLGEDTRSFLQSIVDEAALALESVWLRRRELGALRQIQAIRPKADLTALFSSLLENVYATLEVDFALLIVQNQAISKTAGSKTENLVDLTYGELPETARGFIDGIIQGVLSSGEPVLLGSVSGDFVSPPGARSVMAAPLQNADHGSLGVLLAGSRRAHSFSQRQLTLLQTVAGQMALVVQSTAALTELEYQAMIEERTRLAREIHDGLAQTLGFLKLQAAQMQGYLDRGDLKRLKQSLQTYYQALGDAYQDARYAIDNLRIFPGDSQLDGWLEQILVEFQESVAPLNIKVMPPRLEVERPLAPEVQAQLIRILQEALSNVRKHSRARQVWISFCEEGGDLVLEIRDDGDGFSHEDVPLSSRYGLKGMRERAELIGAEFQIISPPDGGTIVHVALPLTVKERLT